MVDETNNHDEPKTFETKLKQKIKISSAMWKNRRRMAWIALLSILVVTYWCLFVIPVERLKVLDTIVTWFYTIMGTIISAYFGLSTFDQKWNKDSSTKKEE